MTVHKHPRHVGRRTVLKYLAGAAACPTCLSAASAFASAKKETGSHGTGHEAPHWGYEGPGGPERWGELEPGNAVCSLGLPLSWVQ